MKDFYKALFSREFKFFIVGLVVFICFFNQFVLSVSPFGANLTVVKSETGSPDSPEAVQAQAGNVTELNIYGYSITQSWQGYFGNVSGTIQLADSSDNIMFNWSDLSPKGEIYASMNDSIIWTDIQCFNFTADGTFADDAAQRGATSLHGMNLSSLENQFSIAEDDVDGVNETFNLWGPGTHDLFYTNNLLFEEGECRNTRVYSNAGYGEDDKFEEVLLYDPDTKSVVFTTILNQDVLGFDGRNYDFEMLVLEDGHSDDVASSNYYFYVELQ